MLLAFVNLEKWNALPKHYQSVLEQAGHYANTWMMAKYDQLNPQALRRLLAGGTKLHVFSPPIMDACFKATMELHAEIAKENASFKKVNDSMMAYTNNGYQWFQVAENTYDQFMVRRCAADRIKTGPCPRERIPRGFTCSVRRLAEIDRRQIDLRNFDLDLVGIDF